MSLRSYQLSQVIALAASFDFEAVIMAAMRIGYGDRIKTAFPDIWDEYHYRHWSAGGLMPGEPGYNVITDDNVPLERHKK